MVERRGAEVARVHANLIRKHDETDKTRLSEVFYPEFANDA